MAAQAERCRLAVGVFDEPEWLWRALLSLLGDGLTLDQCCLVGLATTFESSAPSSNIAEADRRRLAMLHGRFERLPGFDDGRRIVASAGTLLECWRSLDTARRDLKAELGISAAHYAEILDQIEHGAVALIVKSFSPGQQSTTARTLLQQSAYGVKTYEVALTP